MKCDKNSAVDIQRLVDLIEGWELWAAGRYAAAERDKAIFNRVTVEHGARCYYLCAKQLREALGLPLHSAHQNKPE